MSPAFIWISMVISHAFVSIGPYSAFAGTEGDCYKKLLLLSFKSAVASN